MSYLASRESQTWQSMLGAAKLRFEEAEHLYYASQHAGAIYLFGYVVELILKSAYFQAEGVYASTDNLERLCRNPSGLLDRSGTPVWSPQQHSLLGYSERGHDLMAWYYALSGIRLVPMQSGTASNALNHTAQVAAVWGTFRRYDSRMAMVHEARLVHTSVKWLYNNRAVLWS